VFEKKKGQNEEGTRWQAQGPSHKTITREPGVHTLKRGKTASIKQRKMYIGGGEERTGKLVNEQAKGTNS